MSEQGDRLGSPSSASSRLVLIVDDCGMNVFAVQGILETLGLESDACFDGSEAIQKVKERHNEDKSKSMMYKLIFMDYSMPQVNGCQAAKEIRSYLTEQGYCIDSD